MTSTALEHEPRENEIILSLYSTEAGHTVHEVLTSEHVSTVQRALHMQFGADYIGHSATATQVAFTLSWSDYPDGIGGEDALNEYLTGAYAKASWTLWPTGGPVGPIGVGLRLDALMPSGNGSPRIRVTHDYDD